MLYEAQQIFEAAQRHAVILTVNQRMTRTLVDEYGQWQVKLGASAWGKPQIFTPTLWWQRCLVQNISSGSLLNSAQQHALWQQFIRADLKQHAYTLLQVGATVKQALKAYAALCEHQIALDDYTAHTSEECAFKRWCAAYLAYCDTHGYIDSQRLGTYMQGKFHTGEVPAPAEVWLVGFDEISPQLRSLCDTLAAKGSNICVPNLEVRDTITYVHPCADPEAELQQLAHWAHAHIAAGRHVGIVVPELERQHSAIERILRAHVRAPGDGVADSATEAIGLNISLGKPLSQYGVIHAALRLLQAADPFELDEFGYLLRSPWFSGGHHHMDWHATAEVLLRSGSQPRAQLDTYIRVLEQKGFCSKGIEHITTALLGLCHIKTRHSSRKWGEIFSATLHAAGWPGDHPPDSETYQVLQAWEEQVLPQFASLCAVEGEITRIDAVRQLQRLSDDSVFQPAARDKRLQVVGMLEGVALACDAVWVTGLHAQVLPAPLNYNTFIPVQVQKEEAMPRASMAREIEFCTRLIQQFQALAPEVNFSYPLCSEEGNSYTPSPFLPRSASEHPLLSSLKESTTPAPDQVRLEVIHDGRGIPLATEHAASSPPYVVRGGTHLLKAQAACPFRAYAIYRMRVNPLEVPVEGVDMRVRGSLLHLLLQRFWEEVCTQEELLSRNDAQIRELLVRLSNEILTDSRNGYVPHILRELEQQRLVRLAQEWLEIERERSPFKVLSVEEREELQVGDLKVTAIADRVDQLLPAGGLVLLDYKTGVVTLKDIVGADLLEPQLPVYALYGKHQPALGLAIAQVRAGECCLKGVCATAADSHNTGYPLQGLNGEEWGHLQEHWRIELEQLAQDIAAARAEVDPAQAQTCQFCELYPLCRIQNTAAAVESEGDEI